MAQSDALNFVKEKSEALSKYLTQEHRKIIDNFTHIKESTREQLYRLNKLEAERVYDQVRYAVDSSAKEALYALDMDSPLQLYDCLIPELDAYRPQRLQIRSQWEQEDHVEAKL